MMGVNHATSGAAAWIAATAAMPYVTTGYYPLDSVGVIAGSLVCAGAALLPDADHHNATIAHSVPIVGSLAAGAVGAATGGHRHGAHSVLAVAAVALASFALGHVTMTTENLGTFAIGPGIATMALVCFALKARDLVESWLTAWILGAIAGALIVFFAPHQLAWFPIAVTLGYAVHLAGDFLTTGGLPGLLWPWVPKPPEALKTVPVMNRVWMANGYITMPVLGNAGSVREMLLGFVLALYCVYGLAHEALRGFGVDLLSIL
ncbi:metal-dependent hydrolase [Agromyces sp. ISL-38]|uniref:metal-dependent hydrolase n=1 Tax=Agromyces sp. ISL-38 TaxID=2819107 RepID=UPI001BECEE9B|nr:metal-dependent hydrolase [Agromyces sp. ISL-38]MBT2499313.1 metal-dependent hydrolase [Agromyces sp. ISL-38]